MWAIAKKLKIQGPGSLKQNPEASPPEHTESYPCSPINLTLTDPFQTSYHPSPPPVKLWNAQFLL